MPSVSIPRHLSGRPFRRLSDPVHRRHPGAHRDPRFFAEFPGDAGSGHTVPVTIIGAFIAMAALGFTINLMTLFALILAIGIVVDDAIVIVENSSYYIERGLPPRRPRSKPCRN